MADDLNAAALASRGPSKIVHQKGKHVVIEYIDPVSLRYQEALLDRFAAG